MTTASPTVSALMERMQADATDAFNVLASRVPPSWKRGDHEALAIFETLADGKWRKIRVCCSERGVSYLYTTSVPSPLGGNIARTKPLPDLSAALTAASEEW